VNYAKKQVFSYHSEWSSAEAILKAYYTPLAQEQEPEGQEWLKPPCLGGSPPCLFGS